MYLAKRCFWNVLSCSISKMILFVSFMPVFLLGCSMARMAVRPQLISGATEMKVEGRKSFGFDKPFSFGPYQVTEVNREWTRSTGFSVDFPSLEKHKKVFSSSKATQEYEFMLKDGKGEEWKCQNLTTCGQGFVDVSMGAKKKMGMGMSSRSFVSSFKAKNRSEVWHLTMDDKQDSSFAMKGVLSDGDTSILVQGTRKLAGTPLPLTDHSGFEFLVSGNVVASVEVINKGAVWILPSTEEKLHSPLAVTSAALLLYQNIGRK